MDPFDSSKNSVTGNTNTDYILPDEVFESFQAILNKNIILKLYFKFQNHEEKGLIKYTSYIHVMSSVFLKNNCFKLTEDMKKQFKIIFNLIFERFRKIKCLLKNDKKIFYLIGMEPENFIETYKVVCFLTILIKCRYIDKIQILFELTDQDEDGFLNKNEIKQMITTTNLMLSDECNLIETNSAILSQSLANIKIKGIINSLLFDPGKLNKYLEIDKYVNFDTFYKCLIKIIDYKYTVIPCFINMKNVLYRKRVEKIVQINNKFKKEFFRASSALISEKPKNPYRKHLRNFSANNLNRIIKNVKEKPKKNQLNENNNKIDNSEYSILIRKKAGRKQYCKNEFKNLLKKKKLLLGIKEKTKSFQELLKESTILSQESEKSNNNININEKKIKSSYIRRMSFNMSEDEQPKYFFQADFDKIKKIEAEPAIIKFYNDSNEKIPQNLLNISNLNKNEIQNFKPSLYKKSMNLIKNYPNTKSSQKNITNFKRFSANNGNNIFMFNKRRINSAFNINLNKERRASINLRQNKKLELKKFDSQSNISLKKTALSQKRKEKKNNFKNKLNKGNNKIIINSSLNIINTKNENEKIGEIINKEEKNDFMNNEEKKKNNNNNPYWTIKDVLDDVKKNEMRLKRERIDRLSSGLINMVSEMKNDTKILEGIYRKYERINPFDIYRFEDKKQKIKFNN